MSKSRFNHVFLALMCGAFLCAFVLPPRLVDSGRLHTAGIFSPVSYPLRRLAENIYHPVDYQQQIDNRSREALVAENDQLRQQVVQLQSAVVQLRGVQAERQKLGSLQSLCIHVPVNGADSAGRDALTLSMPANSHISTDAPAVFSGGLAGRLNANWGAARLRLLTDDGFAVTGRFVRYLDSGGGAKPEAISAPVSLVRGLGNGRLCVKDMKLSDFKAAGLRQGDWVVLEDSQWPTQVQGVRLGRVSSANQSAPLFVDVMLVPETDLTRLSDVWVLAEAAR
jgi:cell shape-determining protein MreC